MENKRRMKRIARAMAFALTGAMVLGGAATGKPMTAYAASAGAGSSVIESTIKTGSLTITKHGTTADNTDVLKGAKFTIYKVMSLTPGTNPGEYAQYEKVDAFASALNGVNPDELGNYSSTALENVIAGLKTAAEGTTGIEATTDANGKAVFSDLALGYYLVVETAAPAGYVAGSPFLVAVPSTDNYNKGNTAGTKWVYDVEVEPKNAQVSIDKALAGEETGAEQDGTVKVGDFVKYVINTKMPNYPAEYTEKVVFTIEDVMSDGLEIQNDTAHPVKVKVGGTEVAAGADTYTVTAEPKTGEDPDLTVAFAKDYILTDANKDKDVEITYYAKVTEKAVTGTAGNPNKAILIYNNKPGETTNAETPEIKVYSFNIQVEKFAEGTPKTALEGAEFVLYSDAACKNEVRPAVSTKADGTLAFERLDEGTYYLKETKSPKGYTLLANPIKVEIIAERNGDIATGAFKLKVDGQEVTATTGTFVTRLNTTNGTSYVAVENHKGFTLPSTGGAGIALFLIIGVAGIVVVSVAFTRKSRKAN